MPGSTIQLLQTASLNSYHVNSFCSFDIESRIFISGVEFNCAIDYLKGKLMSYAYIQAAIAKFIICIRPNVHDVYPKVIFFKY